MNREFVSFILVGGAAAVVNIGSRLIFSETMSYEVAVVLAYLCGMIAAFLLNRAFVFKEAAAGQVFRQSMRFALVNMFALAQVWIVGIGLTRLLFPHIGMTWHAETVAHVIAVASPIVSSYFAHKYFSFAPNAPATDGQSDAMLGS